MTSYPVRRRDYWIPRPSRTDRHYQTQKIGRQSSSPEIRLPALCRISVPAEWLCLYLFHASLCACWLPWCTALSQRFHLKGGCVFPQKTHFTLSLNREIQAKKETGSFSHPWFGFGVGARFVRLFALVVSTEENSFNSLWMLRTRPNSLCLHLPVRIKDLPYQSLQHQLTFK